MNVTNILMKFHKNYPKLKAKLTMLLLMVLINFLEIHNIKIKINLSMVSKVINISENSIFNGLLIIWKILRKTK